MELGFDSPAVDHDRPSFRGIEEFDLTDEAQEAGGIAGNAVVRPTGEVEEAEFPDLMVAFLRRERAAVLPAAACVYPAKHSGSCSHRAEEPASLLSREDKALAELPHSDSEIRNIWTMGNKLKGNQLLYCRTTQSLWCVNTYSEFQRG